MPTDWSGLAKVGAKIVKDTFNDKNDNANPKIGGVDLSATYVPSWVMQHEVMSAPSSEPKVAAYGKVATAQTTPMNAQLANPNSQNLDVLSLTRQWSKALG